MSIDGLSRKNGWQRLILVVLSAVLSLYLAIWVSERRMVPDGAVLLDGLQTSVPLGEAPLLPEDRGYGSYIGQGGYPAARISGDITEHAQSFKTPAILIKYSRRKVDLYLNGEPLMPYSRPSRLDAHLFQEPHLFIIPNDAQPPYELGIDVTTKVNQPYLSTPYLGETENLLTSYRWQYVIGVWMVIFSAAACLITGLIAFLLSMRSPRRLEMLAFGMLMLGWAVVCVTYTGMLTGALASIGNLIYAFGIFVVAVSAMAFINEWTFKLRWIRCYAVPVASFFLLSILAVMTILDRAYYVDLILVADFVAVFVIGVMLWQLAQALLRKSEISLISATVFLTSIIAVMVDIVSSLSQSATATVWLGTPVTLHYGPVICIGLGMTILSGFLRSFVLAQRTLADANTILSTRLSAREAEIAAVYAERETEMRDAALVEERKRIMRDMHDGVGGRLLSLSLRAKADRLAPAEMGQELDNSLQELRLIVDSMDTAEGELDLALGALRGRLEPALQEAGIQLDWDAGDLGHQPDYGPREVLSIYRMIQEITTNTIRHAKATNILFSSHLSSQGDIEIAVEDNGIGLKDAEQRQGSKGLKNLRSRTDDLGGRIAFQPSIAFETGLKVQINLPGNI